MKLYNTLNNSHNNRNTSTTNGVNTKIRTLNTSRYTPQFNENKEQQETSTSPTNRLELHSSNLYSNLTVNYPEDYLPYATAKRKKQQKQNNNNSTEANLNNGSENMNNKRLPRDQNTLNNGLIGNVIDSNLPYFSTWEDLSQRTLSNRNDNQNDNNRTNHNRIIKNRIDLNDVDDNVLTGASNSPTIHQQDNHSTKNQINNNNFNGNLSANYQSFHGEDRLVEEEVELFENNRTELRETLNDEYEDDDENCEDEILAGYTRNTLRSTLQSNNYLHNTTLGHRLLMIDSTHSTATITSLQQQLHDTDNQLNDSQSGSGGITNQAFIGLHSCYGYPKCENMNCGNCNKAQLTANIGDHLANSNSSWFSVASDKSKTICSLGCCAILTTCLFILLAIISVVGISIYLGNLTQQNKSNVLPLSGHFKIQNGDQFNDNLYNASSKEFQLKATKYEAILQSALQSGGIDDSVVNNEVYAFRAGSLVVFFRVYLDRRKLMQDYELKLLPNVNHNNIGLDSLAPKKLNEKEEEFLAKLVQNRLKYGLNQLNLIGTDSLIFLTNSIQLSLNYTDPLLYKDDHFINERLQGDKILGSRSDLDTAERNLINLNSIYNQKNKTNLKGRINLAALSTNSNDRKEHIKAVKKLSNATNGKDDTSSNYNLQTSTTSTSTTTTQPSTTKANIVEIFTNTPAYTTPNLKQQTITMRPIIQRFTTPSNLIDKFNHSSFFYSSPVLNKQQNSRLDKPLFFNSFSSNLLTTPTISSTTNPNLTTQTDKTTSSINEHQPTNKQTTASPPSLTTDKNLASLYIDDSESNEWTTIEPNVEKQNNKKLTSLHTESPISIYLKLKQIRKQLMANNTVNHHHHRHSKNDHKNENQLLNTSSTDQNQDSSNLLKLHEALTGGFSPLTFLPVHNKSSHNQHSQQNQKDKYLNIINNSFKNQNVNIVTAVPPNHKPASNTPVHISSMDFSVWRPIQPFSHKSDLLFSMFNTSKNRLSNTTLLNKNLTKNNTQINSISNHQQQSSPSQNLQTSTTSKPKSNLKPINPSLPPKSYTPPTTSVSQHVHRPTINSQPKNNFNNNKNIGQQNNNRTPMGILNLRNDNIFGHRPSSSNNIQNTALPNSLPNNILSSLNLNSNWLLNNNNNNNRQQPQLDPHSPLFGQPLSDSSFDSIDSMFNFNNNFNNPFDEIPSSILRREDNVEQTTIVPSSIYRESRTNLKNNQKNYNKLSLLKNEQIDLETLLGLTEFESFKLNNSNSQSLSNNNNKHNQNLLSMTTSTSTTKTPNSQNNRFQKRIGIVDREFINKEYFQPIHSTRKPITTTIKPFVNLEKINELNKLSSIEDSKNVLIKDKNYQISLTTLPSVNEDLRLNNFNDDITDLTGELPKFNSDGLIEMTTTLLKDDSSNNNLLNDKFKQTTSSLSTSQQFTLNNIQTTTPSTNQIECDAFSEFACLNGKQCISKNLVCNHEINCQDSSDESNCTCADYLTKFNQKRKLCDGILDCADYSDELNCDYCKLPFNSTNKSTDDIFICPHAKSCIYKSQVCDGEFNCPNGSDEEFCVSLADEKEVLSNSLNSLDKKSTIKTYQNEGILVIRLNGVWRALCLENSDVVTSLFGSSSSAYTSLGRSANSEHQQTSSLSNSLSTISKSLLSQDTMQTENGDLIVANSNTATLSTYSLPDANQLQSSNQNNQETLIQPKNYLARTWLDDESSYNWQLDELGRAVCSIQSFNELDSINVTNLISRNSKQLIGETGDSLKYFSMNQPNTMFKNTQKWSNLFKSDVCLSGKIASIRCKFFECGVRPSSNNVRKRIIGGQSSKPTSWPWMAALYREGQFQCGGVVIDNQFLLSAAHCFQNSRNAYWTARLGVLRRGNHYKNAFEQLIRISHVIIHPDYADNKGFLNDIVLLKLEKPIKYSDYVRPICMADKNEDINNYHGKMCSVVGWGKLFESGRYFPDTLQELKLPVISTVECRKRTVLLPLYKIGESQFCAGHLRGGKDSCLGDSGGPLMCPTSDGKWSLLGLISNGDGCGRAGRPGIYTLVSKFVEWIAEEMNKKKELIPVDNELIEKYGNKELLDELKLLNSQANQQDFLNAEFILSTKEKEELMKQNIRSFDKNSRTYTNNLKIAADFKDDDLITTRINRRMAKLLNERKLPSFIEKDELLDTCNGWRCPLGKCINSTQICNKIVDCIEDGGDELNC